MKKEPEITISEEKPKTETIIKPKKPYINPQKQGYSQGTGGKSGGSQMIGKKVFKHKSH